MVRLGNLKFAHSSGVSHMKKVCPNHGIQLEGRMFANGIELDEHGLSQKDVQVMFLACADLDQALQSGQLDAICRSEPTSRRSTCRSLPT